METEKNKYERVKCKDGRYRFRDSEGHLSQDSYEDASYYSGGYAAVECDDGRWKYRDLDGNLSSDDYLLATEYSGKYALVLCDDGQWQHRDMSGNLCDDVRVETKKEKWIQLMGYEPERFLKIPEEMFGDKDFINICLETMREKVLTTIDEMLVQNNSEREIFIKAMKVLALKCKTYAQDQRKALLKKRKENEKIKKATEKEKKSFEKIIKSTEKVINKKEKEDIFEL